MKSTKQKFASFTFVSSALLLLSGCSSTPPYQPESLPPSAVLTAPPPAPSSATPEILDVGTVMETATGMVTVQAVRPADRSLLLKRADGQTAIFKCGPEIKRFDQIGVGDEIMSTITDNLNIFVVKGKMTPSMVAKQGIVRTPDSTNVGGLIVNVINIDAKVLDVDLDSRRVILQYGANQAKSVPVRPSVDLSKVAVNDTVLIRGTQSISIMVSDR